MPKKTKLFLEVFRGRDSKILKKNSDYSELITDFAQSGDSTTTFTYLDHLPIIAFGYL